jgi:HAD superfamily hydrolase (TIGR01549 family)
VPLDAVLLDYGDTLFRFGYDEPAHIASLSRLLEVLGETEVNGERLFEELDPRLWAAFGAIGGDVEIDYPRVVRESLAAVGISAVEDGALLRAIHAAHRSWDPNREVHPQAHELLSALRAEGLRIGVVSNAFDPPPFLHEDLELEGIAPLIDTAVFSSEVGKRKPHPDIYLRALEQLGAEPSRTLFAGDRVLEDVVGPARLGMRTCLTLYYRVDGGDHSLADHRAAEPMDILGAVRTEAAGGG